MKRQSRVQNFSISPKTWWPIVKSQRAAVKFCFLLGKSAAETIVMLKTAYGDSALSKTRVYEWFSRFKNGEMSIEGQPRSGRPATSRSDENVDKINALIREDRRRTIDQLCEMSGISWSSVQRILSEDLHMGRVAAKFVPRLFTGEQRECRLQACFEQSAQRGPWFFFQGPCDFFLFPRLKRDMKGKRLTTVKEVKQKSLKGVKNIPISEFKKCFKQWTDRLQKCVVVKGEYFEGDKNLV